MIAVKNLLEDTGERVIPELMKPTSMLLLEHIARYQFSIHYLKGRVLDIACGTGFGTQLITKAAKNRLTEVIGVDNCAETIKYAQGRYYHPLVSYLVEDAVDPNLPNKLGEFDTILSFETIEHFEEEKQFLDNLFEMLKPGGTLVLSTPFGEGRGLPSGSRFHVHQLTREEFSKLFSDYKKTDIYYQHGVLIEPPREHVDYPLGIAVCKK